jgi:hypothetical protein
MRSVFQYDHEVEVLGFQSSEFFLKSSFIWWVWWWSWSPRSKYWWYNKF